ncbi:hypothetical protein HK102_000307 [Quaeritorhiza haematococci]|nr:hypothetical protein HK102_000307 [Quaeritorhiza haematococci]
MAGVFASTNCRGAVCPLDGVQYCFSSVNFNNVGPFPNQLNQLRYVLTAGEVLQENAAIPALTLITVDIIHPCDVCSATLSLPGPPPGGVAPIGGSSARCGSFIQPACAADRCAGFLDAARAEGKLQGGVPAAAPAPPAPSPPSPAPSNPTRPEAASNPLPSTVASPLPGSTPGASAGSPNITAAGTVPGTAPGTPPGTAQGTSDSQTQTVINGIGNTLNGKGRHGADTSALPTPPSGSDSHTTGGGGVSTVGLIAGLLVLASALIVGGWLLHYRGRKRRQRKLDARILFSPAFNRDNNLKAPRRITATTETLTTLKRNNTVISNTQSDQSTVHVLIPTNTLSSTYGRTTEVQTLPTANSTLSPGAVDSSSMVALAGIVNTITLPRPISNNPNLTTPIAPPTTPVTAAPRPVVAPLRQANGPAVMVEQLAIDTNVVVDSCETEGGAPLSPASSLPPYASRVGTMVRGQPPSYDVDMK